MARFGSSAAPPDEESDFGAGGKCRYRRTPSEITPLEAGQRQDMAGEIGELDVHAP
jgi:hypothetical protein